MTRRSHPVALVALVLAAILSLLVSSVTSPAAAAAASPCELPAGFVHLRTAAPSVMQEIRYSGFHNFVGRPVAGYDAPECILSVPAAAALAKVQSFLESGRADPDAVGQRYSLKVYDCYRPTAAVDHFVSWARNLTDTAMRAEFYPEQNKADLFDLGYIALRSGHSRGSTVDLGVVALPAASQPVFVPGVTPLRSCHAPVGQRWEDNALDFGTGFDCFSERAWTNDTVVSTTAQRNRRLLLGAMVAVGGFQNYELEWWHYTLQNEPFPDTYFNFTLC